MKCYLFFLCLDAKKEPKKSQACPTEVIQEGLPD